MPTALVSFLIATHMEAMWIVVIFPDKSRTLSTGSVSSNFSTLCPLSLIFLPPPRWGMIGQLLLRNSWGFALSWQIWRISFCKTAEGGGVENPLVAPLSLLRDGRSLLAIWRKVLWLFSASFWSFGSCLLQWPLCGEVTSFNQKSLLINDWRNVGISFYKFVFVWRHVTWKNANRQDISCQAVLITTVDIFQYSVKLACGGHLARRRRGARPVARPVRRDSSHLYMLTH
jgi:hypothetical protein